MSLLGDEVERFQRWAENGHEGFGEWEFYYPDWSSLWAAAAQALASESLHDHEVDLLLYALARDNECGFILSMMCERSRSGMRVAHVGVNCLEVDARWQVGVFLGSQHHDEARLLLRKLVEDTNEYVRRRALLASTRHDPVFAEEVAASWITSEHEYLRLAALSVLEETRSPRLGLAAEQLRHDPFLYVRNKAAEIEERGLR